LFPILVLISALLLAGCAALFSVTGIASLFVGASLSAGIMAGAMEFAKIVSVSFLYRYHRQMPKLLRAYMWVGTVVIMIITSVGIYGYLSSAYATSATDIQAKENEVILYQNMQQTAQDNIIRLQTRSTQLQDMRTQQEARVDEYMRLGRSTSIQQRIIREQDAEIKKNQDEITALSKTKDSLALLATTTTNSIGTSGKIGTFYYVAKSFNVPLDTIVKWFILVLVVVFDPMSIALFIAYNVASNKNKRAEIMTPHSPAGPSPNVDNIAFRGDIAHKIVNSEDTPKDTTIETTELNTTPYYMQEGFDWHTDSRWHSDPAAQSYWTNLGIHPPKNNA
jgi:hypothetical protein